MARAPISSTQSPQGAGEHCLYALQSNNTIFILGLAREAQGYVGASRTPEPVAVHRDSILMYICCAKESRFGFEPLMRKKNIYTIELRNTVCGVSLGQGLGT